MNLQTKVRLPEAIAHRLDYGSQLLSLGSCFSEHIGKYLEHLGHHISVNPFGAVYNPASIAEVLERILHNRPLEGNELFEYNGLYHSRLHHGSFSRASLERALTTMNESYHEATKRLLDIDYLLITWGSAWIYEDLESGQVVSNCHKRPEREFARKLWSVEELVARVLPTLERLLALRPNLQIITTISPIRHLRDGAHGNQLSKATLLLMDERIRLALGADRYHYYPAYEIVLDELRDYRFYAEDMAHPSKQTQDYIAADFARWLMSDASYMLSQHVLRLKAQESHRSLHDDHPEYQLRQEQLRLLVDSFCASHPEVLYRKTE